MLMRYSALLFTPLPLFLTGFLHSRNCNFMKIFMYFRCNNNRAFYSPCQRFLKAKEHIDLKSSIFKLLNYVACSTQICLMIAIWKKLIIRHFKGKFLTEVFWTNTAI